MMGPYVIRIDGFASGAVCAVSGEYVKRFDFEAGDGRGFGTFVVDRSDALLFSSREEAFCYWLTVSGVRPRRLDGEPNRPLTAWSVTIMPLGLDIG